MRTVDGRMVRSVGSLQPGTEIEVVLRDGTAEATVDRAAPNDGPAVPRTMPKAES